MRLCSSIELRVRCDVKEAPAQTGASLLQRRFAAQTRRYKPCRAELALLLFNRRSKAAKQAARDKT
jgi:hypothetical protein